jgi:hypothetical protein
MMMGGRETTMGGPDVKKDSRRRLVATQRRGSGEQRYVESHENTGEGGIAALVAVDCRFLGRFRKVVQKARKRATEN